MTTVRRECRRQWRVGGVGCTKHGDGHKCKKKVKFTKREWSKLLDRGAFDYQVDREVQSKCKNHVCICGAKKSQ